MTKAPWVDGLTIAQVLTTTAARHGDHDAVVFPQLHYRRTFRAFHAEVRAVARSLLALGVVRGEHVGIWATNWPQWLLVQFAAAQVGAVLVNVNPAYRAHELEYVLNQADLSTLFLTDRFKGSDYFAILGEVCPELGACPANAPSLLPLSPEAGERGKRFAKCPQLRRVISIKDEPHAGALVWGDFCARGQAISDADLDRRAAEVRADDVVNIQYTSGTTGFPKGAMLTHRNLLLNAFYVGDRMAFTDCDRLCAPVPFYHCFGCVMGTLMCAIHGATLVVPAESFDPLAALQAMQAERCTGLYGVPTMFLAELHHPRFAEFDLRSLRTGVMAGAPCPVELMRAVVERMGAREITIAYGLTEASPVITQTDTADSLEHRVGTVGRIIPGVEVKLVRPGTTEPVPRGAPGELMTRGHGVMKGYYHKPAETAAALPGGGWLHTGDLAQETPDGYYRITGRIKDMIIRGGENIYPREIEEFLYTHAAIAEVQVVGLPDERFGETVSAWVRLKAGATLTEEELRTFCRDKVAHFKVPRYVVFVDEFPTTVTGKVQKYRLRELGVARFGLQAAARIETA